MKSVLQEKKECYVCGTPYGLHSHHVFYGTANRKISEGMGLKVWLCGKHHNLSNEGVHFNKKLDLQIKCDGQKYFEEHYGNREAFINTFGKSYIDQAEIMEGKADE